MTPFRAILALFSVVIIMMFSGCSSEPVSLDGRWAASEDPKFTAVVDNGTITIEGGGMLYWKGSVPGEIEDGESFSSEGDVNAMSASLLGSSELTKNFTYDDDTLSFEGSGMGRDFEVDLKRQ